MYLEVIIAGFGGQGVMLMGETICEAATSMGVNATFFPSYGPETRGGTANCNVIVSDKPIASPVLATSQNIIVMNKPSLDKFESKVKEKGYIFVNSSLIDREVQRTDIEVIKVPANEIAEKLGSSVVANMVMLGAFIEKIKVIPIDKIKYVVEKFLGEEKKELIDINLKALDEGVKLVK
ncbi:MAG TPA: 2-oxoacid:acceptor oxidoreductase family protein [Caldisericia bacterium]|nr:2-oxoacid:acceptor oxidoreductase family protein [Caldisericia bacterium]HOL82715.1 2-oxoacid:acceptor oxidoreductase family protein [Caldisericia bacterium]HPC56902.1 2-oxoacid:acceptor oxidoreductase family protein [Caldisericia bacterium]HPP43450.1 2-oxoacid:acceptor oxidoreductase family protein [Caldisericia bacterium]HRT36752.1 2-oxoacid:acceptor oxidoreductase family protein [Caldisericia bacterium]